MVNSLSFFGTLFCQSVVKTMSGMGISLAVITWLCYIYGIFNSLLQASIGLFILAFFTAGANTGFLTFFQNAVPIDMMGRIGSVYHLFNSVLIIIFTTVLGAMAYYMGTKLTVIIGVLVMPILSIILLFIIRLNKDITPLNSH